MQGDRIGWPFPIEVPVVEFACPWEFILVPLFQVRRLVGRDEAESFRFVQDPS